MAAKPLEKSQSLLADLGNELKKVTWPTKADTTRLTIIVVMISLIIGFYIGIIDFLLAKALEFLTAIK